MPSLCEIQREVRRAVIAGDSTGVADLLLGGRNPRLRLAIHHRHYHASLVQVLIDRFPATAWLVGGQVVADATRAFVVAHPPARPCLAEYGAGFPAFLAARTATRDLPYLADFCVLEWRVGEAAVEVAREPVAIERLASLAPDDLADARLLLQPGVRYLSVSWNVDELMTLYLTDCEPQEFRIARSDIGLEVRGTRDDVGIQRLTPGDCTFRSALVEGCSLADASERACRVGGFDPGQALVALAASGLIAGVEGCTERGER